jgi:hypothetical protein
MIVSIGLTPAAPSAGQHAEALDAERQLVAHGGDRFVLGRRPHRKDEALHGNARLARDGHGAHDWNARRFRFPHHDRKGRAAPGAQDGEDLVLADQGLDLLVGAGRLVRIVAVHDDDLAAVNAARGVHARDVGIGRRAALARHAIERRRALGRNAADHDGGVGNAGVLCWCSRARRQREKEGRTNQQIH